MIKNPKIRFNMTPDLLSKLLEIEKYSEDYHIVEIKDLKAALLDDFKFKIDSPSSEPATLDPQELSSNPYLKNGNHSPCQSGSF